MHQILAGRFIFFLQYLDTTSGDWRELGVLGVALCWGITPRNGSLRSVLFPLRNAPAQRLTITFRMLARLWGKAL